MLYDVPLNTHFLMGTARYPSNAILAQAIEHAQPDMITLSLRRQDTTDPGFRQVLEQVQCPILPNTAGCTTAKEAVNTAKMARELFNTRRIKLEVIGHEGTLQPDPFELAEAARILCSEGFEVFPYTTEDLVLAEALLKAGCKILMPWASPIGSGRGLRNIEALVIMREEFKDIPLVVDAGIRSPSQAAAVMELGFDAVLINTAIASAGDPVIMAQAFQKAVAAGRQAQQAGLMQSRLSAAVSSPQAGLAKLA